jgi:hypothetical protein
MVRQSKGTIGCDGQFGAGQALDDKLSINRVTIHVRGTASVVDGARLREAAFTKVPGGDYLYLSVGQPTEMSCRLSLDSLDRRRE